MTLNYDVLIRRMAINPITSIYIIKGYNRFMWIFKKDHVKEIVFRRNDENEIKILWEEFWKFDGIYTADKITKEWDR